MRSLVIVNPMARRGQPSSIEAEISRALRLRHLDFELARTTHPGHARELVTMHGDEFDAIVVCGGDGTLHEVVQSLDLERHLLGVVPRGTGNDFAWMNGIPRNLDSAIARIAAVKIRRIDLGLCGEWRFHNSVGIGFEGRVNFESQQIRRLRGAAVYVLAVMRTLSRRQSQPMRIQWQDGEWSGDVFMASVCLGRRVGGAFRLAPAARNDDGLLDLMFAGNLRLPGILALLPRTFNGSHTRSSRVRVVQSPQIRIQASDGAPVHIDGEFIGLDVRELDLRILPGALRLL